MVDLSRGSGGDTGSGGAAPGSGGAGSGGAGSGGAGIATGGGAGSGGAVISPDAAPDLAPDLATVGDARDAGDAPDAAVERNCSASTFPFESATTNARLGLQQAAAKSVSNSVVNPYCGTHSLEITTAFSGMSGDTARGEVLIDLAAAQQNLSGKTLTIHVSAIPMPSPTLYVALTLISGAGNIDLTPTIKPLTTDWTTQSYKLQTSADGGVAMVGSLSVQIFDFNNYSGKLYIDGLDIR